MPDEIPPPAPPPSEPRPLASWEDLARALADRVMRADAREADWNERLTRIEANIVLLLARQADLVCIASRHEAQLTLIAARHSAQLRLALAAAEIR